VRNTAVLTALCLCLAPAAPAAEPLVTAPQVTVETGPPAQVTVRGTSRLPDKTILSVSIKNERLDIRGKHLTLVDLKSVQVKDGAFACVLGGQQDQALHPGNYFVDVDCDPTRQYRDVQEQLTALLKTAAVKAQATFNVPFTEDYATPSKALVSSLTDMAALWEELEKEHKANAAKQGDAARLAVFEQFLTAWGKRVQDLSSRTPSGEDILYPETRQSMNGLSSKINLFQELYSSELKGVPCQTQVDHPNWFEPPVSEDLSRVRRLLAAEFAFNTARKVVEYGYDRADELMKSCTANPPKPNASAQWARFRAEFGKDLEQSRGVCEAMSNGPLKAEMAAIASDALPLLTGGQRLLEAIDQEIARPGSGKAALDAAKASLTKHYLSVQAKVLEADRAISAPPK